MLRIKPKVEEHTLYQLLKHEKTGLNRLRLSVQDSRSGETVAWWDEVLNADPVPTKRKPDSDLGADYKPSARIPLLGVKPEPDQDRPRVPVPVPGPVQTQAQSSSYIPTHVSPYPINQDKLNTFQDVDYNENSPYDLGSIFISRLDVRTTKEDLYTHFSYAGPIVRITRLKSKQCSQRFSGSAYVQYQFPGSALNAIYNLHNSFLRGCKILVKVSHSFFACTRFYLLLKYFVFL